MTPAVPGDARSRAAAVGLDEGGFHHRDRDTGTSGARVGAAAPQACRAGAGSRAVAASPRTAPRWHQVPSGQHSEGQTETINLLTTGRGISKPGHFNIGAAREREGRL